MAYSTSNPPIPLLSVPASQGSSDETFTIWLYKDADASTTVDGDGYFTNGQLLGMRAGDLVIVQDTDTYLTTMHAVLSLSTSDDSVDLGDGTTVGDSTDSD